MNVTVCELPNDHASFARQWDLLCSHAQDRRSDLVLLPELPFSRWLAADPTVVPSAWEEAVEEHVRWIERLPELGAATVVSTRPVVESDTRFNQGYVWRSADPRPQSVHKKRYLPNEPGFWEATWYSPGDRDFTPVDMVPRLGLAICTEIWFQAHAREYGKKGVQVLACPRATLRPSVDKWIAGGRAAAVVSGAFCISSNFSGPVDAPHGSAPGDLGDWGGAGWIIEPEEGEVLGVTSAENPFLTLEIDLDVADTAKSTYPRCSGMNRRAVPFTVKTASDATTMMSMVDEQVRGLISLEEVTPRPRLDRPVATFGCRCACCSWL